MSCTRTLPKTVASTGPAITGRPAALAVIWLSSWFWKPPPKMWMTSMLSPVSLAQPVEDEAVFHGQAFQYGSHYGPFVLRNGLPCGRA
jgi:hypothetical protein